MSRSTIGISLGIVCAALILASCASTPKVQDIPADLSPALFFQRAQEFLDKEQYPAALQYLNEFKRRNVDSTVQDIKDKLLEADYLIAQISYKKGDLKDADAKFRALLSVYDGVPQDAASPPQWIRVLCTKLIDTIAQKSKSAKQKAGSPAVDAAADKSSAQEPGADAPPEASSSSDQTSPAPSDGTAQ